MEIILREDVKKLGKKGEVISVADGYAKNYLFPRKLALPLTRSSQKALEAEKKDQAQKEKRLEKEAKQIAKQLESKKFKIMSRSGEEGKLFGSITSQDIADAIKDQAGVEISKRDVLLEDHIKYLGEYKVDVKLTRGIKAKISFEVVEE